MSRLALGPVGWETPQCLLKHHNRGFGALLRALAALCRGRVALETMADKENQIPETNQKAEGQKDMASKTIANPRKRYMSTDSDSENMPPVALQRLEDPDRPCHHRKTSFYTEKASETQEPTRLQIRGNSLKKGKAMRSIVRTCLYGLLKSCLSDHLVHACPGCKQELGGQQGHPCLYWDENDFSRMLNMLCGKICFKKIFYIITLVAYRNKVLCLTNRTLGYINKLIKSLAVSDKAYDFLKRLLRSTDEKILQDVQLTLQHVQYGSFYCVSSMRE